MHASVAAHTLKFGAPGAQLLSAASAQPRMAEGTQTCTAADAHKRVGPVCGWCPSSKHRRLCARVVSLCSHAPWPSARCQPLTLLPTGADGSDAMVTVIYLSIYSQLPPKPPRPRPHQMCGYRRSCAAGCRRRPSRWTHPGGACAWQSASGAASPSGCDQEGAHCVLNGGLSVHDQPRLVASLVPAPGVCE